MYPGTAGHLQSADVQVKNLYLYPPGSHIGIPGRARHDGDATPPRRIEHRLRYMVGFRPVAGR